MTKRRKDPWSKVQRHNARQAKYRVTYSGTSAYDTFGTKKKAEAQARHAVKSGNMQSCVEVMLPSGGYHRVKCMKRKKRGR